MTQAPVPPLYLPPTVVSAPRLSDTPGAVRHVGPELGQNTDEVLADILGYAEDQIIAWRDAGIV